jgi:hypothetical protein
VTKPSLQKDCRASRTLDRPFLPPPPPPPHPRSTSFHSVPQQQPKTNNFFIRNDILISEKGEEKERFTPPAAPAPVVPALFVAALVLPVAPLALALGFTFAAVAGTALVLVLVAAA